MACPNVRRENPVVFGTPRFYYLEHDQSYRRSSPKLRSGGAAMRTAGFAWVAILLGAGSASAQVTTVCSLSGNTAYCTSNDQGARIAEQQREQYETGQAIGRGIGSAIFRAHFPGWRRKYCSTHPGQPFVYSNAAGDSISGTCPSAEGLANEVASEWLAKHPDYKPAPENGQTMVAYIAEHHLFL
jgi:hypothetical protein